VITQVIGLFTLVKRLITKVIRLISQVICRKTGLAKMLTGQRN